MLAVRMISLKYIWLCNFPAYSSSMTLNFLKLYKMLYDLFLTSPGSLLLIPIFLPHVPFIPNDLQSLHWSYMFNIFLCLHLFCHVYDELLLTEVPFLIAGYIFILRFSVGSPPLWCFFWCPSCSWISPLFFEILYTDKHFVIVPLCLLWIYFELICLLH